MGRPEARTSPYQEFRAPLSRDAPGKWCSDPHFPSVKFRTIHTLFFKKRFPCPLIRGHGHIRDRRPLTVRVTISGNLGRRWV